MNQSVALKVTYMMTSRWTQVLACLLLAGTVAQAQPAPSFPGGLGGDASVTQAIGTSAKSAAEPDEKIIVDPMVQRASCCGYPGGNGAASYGCGGTGCVPGRPKNNWCNSDSCFGRLFGGVCDNLCWSDPCYEPRWILGANAAFFQDSPRPVTQTRIRWDAALGHGFPDAGEFFWARIGGKGPGKATPPVRYDDLTFYQEIAAKGASVFVEMNYRSLDGITNPGSSGFGDMNVGFKSVLLDRELLLVSMQFRTFIPVGNPGAGLGTGHVALEPSLLAALKLAPSTYLQTQLAEWIPLGGTPGFAGAVFHYHFSLNHYLYQQADFLSVIGTMELNGYTFRGMYTDFPTGVPLANSGASYINVGPGLRVMLCDKADFGVGMGFDITNNRGPSQIYRTELRFRF